MVYLNSGESTIKGIEFDTTYRPFAYLELSLAGSVNDINITAGGCGGCAGVYGRNPTTGLPPSAVGHQPPNTSKYQSSVGIQYNNSLGVNSEKLRVEAFVTNLTNDKAPLNYAIIPDLGNFSGTNDSLLGGLPQLRTYGVRASYTF